MYVVPFCFCALLFGECIVAPQIDQCHILSVWVSVAIILFHDHFIHLFQSTAFSPLCLMSSITLTGFFGLLHGKCVSHPKAGDSSVVVHHTVYSSIIQCTLSDVGDQPMAIPAEIRLWCPPSQPLHPDSTFAFIVAKAYIPSPGSLPNMALLDVFILYHFLVTPMLMNMKTISLTFLPHPLQELRAKDKKVGKVGQVDGRNV